MAVADTAVRIMGIVNTTPDSFSDGGKYLDPHKAFSQAKQLIDDGADILDIGGESTRPGAQAVDTKEELQRTIPVISAIRKHSSIPISIDTRKAEVAKKALEAGADIVNDISALRYDPAMLSVLRQSQAEVILMHMQGEPATMQTAPTYHAVVDEILTFLQQRIEVLEKHGIDRQRIIVDPGIGFGKTLAHNLALVNNLASLQTLGCRVLLGHSRKSFLGGITHLPPVERDLATAVVSAMAVDRRVDILRVHNVAATRQAVQIAEAIKSSGLSS